MTTAPKKNYGHNLAQPEPDEDDRTKVAYHDHRGENGHADDDHGHHLISGGTFPAYELTVTDGPDYIPENTGQRIGPRSKLTLTAPKGPLFGVPHNRSFVEMPPDLYLIDQDVIPTQYERISVRETEIDGKRQFELELPIVITKCRAFLAHGGGPIGGASISAAFVGPAIDLPLPAVAPAPAPEPAGEAETESEGD